MARSLLLLIVGLAACMTSGPSTTGTPLDQACQQTSDCGPNPGATCARVCADHSNPCVFACRESRCVLRGCPEDVDGGPPDAAAAGVHGEGEPCDDGLACAAGLVCTGVGDPCPTYPSCKVCYLPCGPGGVCPSGYRACIPPYGQGGNVCIK